MKDMHVATLSITALVDGERAFLYDRNGKRLSSHAFAVDRLRPAGPDITSHLAWRVSANGLANVANLNAGQEKRRSSWDKRIDSLVGSARLRAHDLHLPRARRRSEDYPTGTWDAAVSRMAEQALNCYRYNSRSGWVRWSYTVTKNQNRRVQARYAKD